MAHILSRAQLEQLYFRYILISYIEFYRHRRYIGFACYYCKLFHRMCIISIRIKHSEILPQLKFYFEYTIIKKNESIQISQETSMKSIIF